MSAHECEWYIVKVTEVWSLHKSNSSVVGCSGDRRRERARRAGDGAPAYASSRDRPGRDCQLESLRSV
ncbi:hypothetical protein ACFX19_039552 [Malus domestica]